MDKLKRKLLEKKKQRKRLNELDPNKEWINENQVGKLKNHTIPRLHKNDKPPKYRRSKLDIDDE